MGNTGAFKDNPNNDYSFIAEVALAVNYAAVKLGSDTDSVDLADANSDTGIGFVQSPQATANAPVTVRTAGFSLAKAGSGGITKGDKLTPSTAGTLVATTTATHKVCAIAQETLAEGEIGEIQIISPAVRYDTF